MVYDAVRQTIPSQQEPDSFMSRALELAARGIGTTYPNPRVGAVVVKNGRVVGEGFHVRAGEPHAEVLALQAAGSQAKGATVYVTLEPCSHTGRTGPCAQALIEAGVAEVVAAAYDPNPNVAGGGFRMLVAAGLSVRCGMGEFEATRLNEAFFYAVVNKRPFLHVKWAMTLDGKTAPPAGGTQIVTGPESRCWVHEMRASHPAVLVGGETVRVDDPHLTVRDFAWNDARALRQPLRIVATNHPVTLKRNVFAPDAPRLVLFGADPGAAHREALRHAGIDSIVAQDVSKAGIDWDAALNQLGERDIRSVFIEAGPQLAGTLIRKRLAQRVSVLINMRLLGGVSSRPAVGGLDPVSFADAMSLSQVETRWLGADLLVSGLAA